MFKAFVVFKLNIVKILKIYYFSQNNFQM